MDVLFQVLFCCLCVGNVSEKSELICSQRPIVALVGDDVILPCHLEPPISASDETVEWTRSDLDPKYVHFHQDGRLMFELQNSDYFFRTRLFMDEMTHGNVSMKIFRVKLSDTGTYRCCLPSMQKEAYIQLTVGESEVIGSHEPVKAAVGDDVILPCCLEPPFDVTTQTVEWKHDNTMVHVFRNKKDDPVPQDENFRGRTSLFHDEMVRGNFSLKLTNVTERDAGNYTCFVPKLNKRGYVTLIVVDEKEAFQDPIMETGWSIWKIIVIVLGLAIILAIVCCVWKKCKKTGPRGKRKRRGRNTQNNKKKDNTETVSLKSLPNSSDTNS